MRHYGVEEKFPKVCEGCIVETKVVINGAKSSWFGVEEGLKQGFYDGNGVEELERAQLGVKLEERWCGALMYADYIVLVADTEMELQTMLEVVQAYVMRWRMKFNRSKSKIMAVRKRVGGMSWKIGEKITEEVEEFNYLGVWFDGKLQGNVHLEKMANKAEE